MCCPLDRGLEKAETSLPIDAKMFPLKKKSRNQKNNHILSLHHSSSHGPETTEWEIEPLEPRILLTTVDIYAAGQTGDELLQLMVDGRVAKNFRRVGGDYDSRQFVHLQYETSGEVTADQISIRFKNDRYRPQRGYDRNLFVDRIELDSVTYETENPATYVSAYWGPNGKTAGFLQVEELNIRGKFYYSSAGASMGTQIAVSAHGATGHEQMDLLVGGELVGTYQVPTYEQTYYFISRQDVSLSDVRVRFSNDWANPSTGYDRNLTVSSLSLVSLADGHSRTSSPLQYSVYSTGTYLPSDGIQPGYGRGTTLHANGYFQFSDHEDRSYTGHRNNVSDSLLNVGSAQSPMPRYASSQPHYGGDGYGDTIISEAQRPDRAPSVIPSSPPITPFLVQGTTAIWSGCGGSSWITMSTSHLPSTVRRLTAEQS